ncbi:MAG: hypothetical protein L0227_08015 [Chloroflexi bacterium]|nr:hypothetical protein [Chloroflexota bacterium]
MPNRTAVGETSEVVPRARARARARLRIYAAIAAVVLAALLGAPGPVAAADGLTVTSTSTYTLVPDAGRVDVTVTLTIKNSKRSITTYYPCIAWDYDPVQGWHTIHECPKTTSYYFDTAYLWVEAGAVNVKASADRGSASASVAKRDGNFVEYKVALSRINYGQTRKVTVTYSLGGAPRSDSTVRAGRAYASFCAIVNGLDSSAARIVVPSAFDMTIETSGLELESTTDGATTVYDTGSLPAGAADDFWACFTGDNPDGYETTGLISPSGRQIVLEAWPEDPEWANQTRAEIAEAIGALEALVGRGLPGTGTITVREAGPGDVGWAYAGTFDPDDLVARVTERLDEPGTVAHELSHTWFNDDLFSTRWLSEGSAAWAESTITGDDCSDPGLPAGSSKPPLVTWKFAGPRASEDELAAIHYEYEAACYVVSEIASRIGAEGMRAVFAALLDHKVAYQSDSMPSAGSTAPVGARQWLDTVDELGLVPAGVDDLDFAQELLYSFRAIPDRAALDDRSEARAAYHALLEIAGTWDLPPAIVKPMSGWAFDDAQAAIATAEKALASIDLVETTLPGVDADAGPVAEMWQDATTLEDLEAAAELAAAQAEAAAAVAAAESRYAAPRDLLGQIGLLGTDLGPNLERGIAAVAAADLGAAQAESAHIAAVLDAANQDGTVRVAVTIVALIVLLIAVFLIRRRRARRSAAAAAAALALATPAPDVAIADGAEVSGPEATAQPEPGSADIDPHS